MLTPTFVVNVVADNIPVTLKGSVLDIVKLGVNVSPSSLTNSFIFLNPWLDDVVTCNWPVVLLNDAVLIPNELPVVGIPTIPTIDVPAPVMAETFALSRGATPNPPVDPNETITPPLGSWFWLTSESEIILVPFADVIPVNVTSLTPLVSENS